MTWKVRLCLSVLIGFAITGIGIGLMLIGGWGPCGPASWIAEIGGYLNLDHVTLWCVCFPGIEKVRPEILLLLFVPAVDWSVLTFVVLSFVVWISRVSRPIGRG